MLSPTLETERLVLRRFKESDIDMQYEIIKDKRLSTYICFPDFKKDRHIANRRINLDGTYSGVEYYSKQLN
jgi:hypothetical protein